MSKVLKMMSKRRTEEDLYNSVCWDFDWHVRRDQKEKWAMMLFLGSVKYVYRTKGD